MVKLSAVIIVRNAEDQIKKCIENVSFANEVIVIDGGSKDKTKEIAEKTKAKVYEDVSEDFSQMRNKGLEKASGEWILYVDVDERVSEDLKKEIIQSVNRDDFDCFVLKRKNFYFHKYEWPKTEKIQRLFRKKSLKGWYGKLHESPKIEGRIGYLNGFLLHYTHSDLSSMLEKTIEWSKVEADLRLKANHPRISWWRFPRVMTTAFFDSYLKQKGYKAGTAGLIESIYQSFSMFVTYARLWERQNTDAKNS